MRSPLRALLGLGLAAVLATPTHLPTGSAAPADGAPAASTAARATSSAKGVSLWQMRGVSSALASSGASWYYTWAVEPGAVRAPRGTTFVPMVWGSGSVTSDTLRAIRREPSPHLLTFNEPDLAEQANMTVEEALDLWPRLERTGKRLSSPAVAWGGADEDGWLDRFMRGARERDLDVDFVALHWYGSDFDPKRATDQLERYLRDVHARYGKPIWLTEYALMAFDRQPATPAPSTQAAFVRRSTAMLERLPYVRRYAWFALPAPAQGRSTGLYRPGAKITTVGRAYRAAG